MDRSTIVAFLARPPSWLVFHPQGSVSPRTDAEKRIENSSAIRDVVKTVASMTATRIDRVESDIFINKTTLKLYSFSICDYGFVAPEFFQILTAGAEHGNPQRFGKNPDQLTDSRDTVAIPRL